MATRRTTRKQVTVEEAPVVHKPVMWTVAPPPEHLVIAVAEYLESTLKDRKYCPRCMGMLEGHKHYDSCKLGKLIVAFEQVNHDLSNQ
jgi:hypothetical protein